MSSSLDKASSFVCAIHKSRKVVNDICEKPIKSDVLCGACTCNPKSKSYHRYPDYAVVLDGKTEVIEK